MIATGMLIQKIARQVHSRENRRRAGRRREAAGHPEEDGERLARVRVSGYGGDDDGRAAGNMQGGEGALDDAEADQPGLADVAGRRRPARADAAAKPSRR